MNVRSRFSVGFRVAVVSLASLGAVGVWSPSRAVAQSPEPAFYTYQAPGGASTYGRKVIALTFDDGPGPYTPQVLSVLEQYHVPATFFEIGENVVEYPQYTKMVAAAGYPVEDHTWTHPDLATIPVADFPYEIDQTQNEIKSLTGQTPACVRPPYDAWDQTVLDQIAQRGLTTMSYSVDPRDWSMPGVQAIVDAVVGGAFPGAVVDMHDGGGDRSETVEALPQIIVDLRSIGYSFVSICGSFKPPVPTGPQTSAAYSFGSAPAAGRPVYSSNPYSGIADAPDAHGYWLTAADGGVFSFDDVPFYGSLPGLGIKPAAPIVGIATTPDGRGYWLVGADGGVFSFGDASFAGSLPRIGIAPAQPVVGLAITPDGRGYWLVTAAGEVYSFGDASFYGSLRSIGVTPAQPVVGMAATPDGRGYWLAAQDGGVFSFGDAKFYGSMGGKPLNRPVSAIAPDISTGGYWLVAEDGGVFSFNAPFFGSRAAQTGSDWFFGIGATDAGRGYLLVGETPL